mgnify:FL=1
MAQTFNGLTAYMEEQKNRTDFLLDALLGNDVLPFIRAAGTFIPDMKEMTRALPTLTGTVGIQDGASCSDDFDNSNDTTIGQTTLTVKKARLQEEYCAHGESWETYFTALGLPAGQHAQSESLGIWQPYLIADINRRIAKRIAINAWLGNQSGDTWTIDGWHDLLLAASIGVYNASSNITGANVGTTTPTNGGSAGTDAEGVFNICTSLVTAALSVQQVNGADFAADIISGNAVIVMSPMNRELMRQNYLRLGGNDMPEHAPGLAGLQGNAFAAFKMPGHQISVVTQNWIPNSTILLVRNGNLVFGTDLEADLTALKVWYSEDFDTIRWRSRFKMGMAFRQLNGLGLKYWGPTT